MVKYILEGDNSEIRKVLRENSIRQKRGVIKFSPLSDSELTLKNESPFESEVEYLNIQIKHLVSNIECRNRRIAELESENKNLTEKVDAFENLADTKALPDSDTKELPEDKPKRKRQKTE